MAGALALAALMSVTTLTGQLIKDAGDPAPVVREYLEAIAAGDATAATRMLEFETDAGERFEDAESVLLNYGVFGSAIERIEVGRVETIQRSEDRAVVRAELSLAGESFVNEFALEGATGSLFTRDSWQLTSPLIGLVAVELPSETDMLPDRIAVDLGGERLSVEHSVFAIGVHLQLPGQPELEPRRVRWRAVSVQLLPHLHAIQGKRRGRRSKHRNGHA